MDAACLRPAAEIIRLLQRCERRLIAIWGRRIVGPEPATQNPADRRSWQRLERPIETTNETRARASPFPRRRGLAFVLLRCGGAGIRTPGGLAPSHAFEACSLGHSDTPPSRRVPDRFRVPHTT